MNLSFDSPQRIVELLQLIWTKIIDPDVLANYLQGITTRLDSISATTSSILVEVQAINANTTSIQTSLNNAIALLTAIEADTTTLVTGLANVEVQLQNANTALLALTVDTTDIRAKLATLILEVQDFKTSMLAKMVELLKYEDVPHVSGDAGVQSLSVRQDTPTISTSLDGDYQSLKTNNLGLLYVNSFQSLPFNSDYLAQSNPDGNGYFQTITYKKGGASGTVTKTVTLTFNAGGDVLTYLES